LAHAYEAMEKFRLAQYGFIQIVALAYGILGSSTAAKAGQPVIERGLPSTPLARAVGLYHDYGIFLSLIILGWAIFCAYHSTPLSRRNIGEETIIASGLALALIFFALGSILIFITLGTLVSSTE
jgi:hypothetical protein